MKIGLRMTVLFCCQLAAVAQTAPLQSLQGHVPAVVARLTPLGRLPATNVLHLAVGLPLRNRGDLTNFLQGLYDPASPNYHQYLTPDQFAERFGPTREDYQAVSNFAVAHGFKVTGTHPNRTLLDVSGSVVDVEKTFHVTLHVYQHPTEQRTFFAPDVEPSLDLAVPVLHISGLDNYALPRPRLKFAPAGHQQTARPNVGSGPDGYYMGNDFRTAYVPGTSLNGAGQAVGLLQFDGYTTSDITYYENLASRTNVTLTNVLLDGFDGEPTGNGGEVEVSLDIEMVISMAPAISRVIVYEAGPSGLWHDILNRMATDNLAKQLSCSWYIPDGPADTVADGIFQQMAAQGQSFYSASGDDDAFTGLIPFPGDTPYITEVGGTMLTTSTAGGPWGSESAWNRGNGIGTGGGISTQYAIPSWQSGVSMANNQGSTTMRNVPDVALTAEDVYVRADGVDQGVGGTSCAAPLWAGFTALVNQQAASFSRPTVGFVNPAIYAIGLGQNYTAAFHDITTGNNTSSSSPNEFYAVTGYDLTTGWGSPAGQELINLLAPPDTLIITPTKGFVSSGGPGGPFTITSQSLTLTNVGTNSFSWTMVNTSSWLTVTPTNGTLTHGGPAATVTASLNTAASNLVAGTYSATVWFTNLSDLVGQSRNFTLTVLGGPVITSQPTNQTALIGTTATFTVGVSGLSPLFYQWRFDNSSNIPNATNATLTLTGLTVGQAGSYSVVVSNSLGSATSSNATLTILTSLPLVENGGFELGSFADWTTSGNFEDCAVVSTSPYVHSGVYGAELGPVGSLGYISQTLATTIGQTYQVSCWLYCNGEGPNEFSVSWNGAKLFDQTNIGGTLWTNLQFITSATVTNTVLSFGFRDDPSYLGLDDIAVYGTSINNAVEIAWTPGNIVYGTPLGSNQLNATANAGGTNVPGSFAYTPALGTVLYSGTHALSVNFTPNDTTKYNGATTNATIVVSNAPLTVTASNATWFLGQSLPTFTGAITGLVNNDNITATYTSTNTAPGINPNAIIPSLVDPSNLETNYNVTLIDGALTVEGVTVTAPANGTFFLTNQSFIFSAAAYWPSGLQGLALYTNSVLAASNSLSDISIVLSNLPGGSYQLTAVAISNGLSITSAVVTVTLVIPGNGAGVAVFGALTITNWNSDVTSNISNTSLFSQVSGFLAGVGEPTPSLAQLEQYSAVLVYTDSSFNDPAGMGNVLADYVDAGGGVVLADFDFNSEGFDLQGRLATGGYLPLTTGIQTEGTEYTLAADQPAHPILNGVTSFNGGASSYHNLVKITNGASLVAHWTDGQPLVATTQPTAGRVVALNFYPPSSNVRGDLWEASTDGGLLMANALFWAGGGTKFTASPTNGPTPLTVNFTSPNSDSAGNAISNWNWSFGDGATSTNQNPSHQYTNVGVFSPGLTVTNTNDVAIVATGPSISVTFPTFEFTANPTNGIVPLTVSFTSPGSDSAGIAISNWNWSFGDGTISTNQNPSHQYTNVGHFSPSLTVTNANNLTIAATGPSITVASPTLQFTASPTNGPVPLTVNFTSPSSDSAGNVISNWNWSFGDGATSTNQNPSHSYTNVGILPPGLIVTNTNNLAIVATGPSITVTPEIPVITWTPSNIVYGTPLGSNQLNAIETPVISGAFTYNPPTNTVLNAGANILSVLFTQSASTNYGNATTNVLLVVTPAALTATGDSVTRAYGQANPPFKGTITGVTNGDNITAIYSCSAATNTPVGMYAITPSLVDPGNRQTNYTVNLVNGTLTIAAPPQIQVFDGTNVIANGQTSAVTFPSHELNQIGGSGVVFTVTNGGGLPLTLTNITAPPGYALDTNPPSTITNYPWTIAAGGSDTFSVQFSTDTVGVHPGSIVISNNDPSNGVFSFSVTGTVTGLPTLVELDLTASPNNGGTVSGGGTFPELFPEFTTNTVTATPNPGYLFVNWTQGGNVVSTSTNYTLQFNSNVALVANFIPLYTLGTTALPANGGTVSPGGADVAGSQITVTATPKRGFVFIGWTGDATGTSNPLLVTLNTNLNIMANFAVNATNITLTVTTNGGGAVSPNLNGKDLKLNKSYILTAKATGANVFSNWTGSITTSKNPLVIKPESSMALQANFIPNPFLPAKGTYNGLFTNTDGVTEQTAGMLKGLTIGTNGIYSGMLLINGASNTFNGTFDVAGQAAANITRFASQGGPLSLTMTLLTSNNAAPQVTGTVSGTNSDVPWVAALTADRAATLTSAEYTMLIEPDTNSAPATSPGGAGYALITNHLGTATITGALADGTGFTQSAPVSLTGDVPIFANLYRNKGLLLGWINLEQSNASETALTWVHPTNSSGLFTDAFTSTNTVALSPWTDSSTVLTGLGLTNLTVGTNDYDIAIADDGAVTGTSVKGSVSLKTGLLTVTNGSGPANTIGHGVILTNATSGGGYFQNSTNAGAIELGP